MRTIESTTELQLRSSLPRAMIFWLAITGLVCGLYIMRCLSEDIRPQDHVALALIVCFLLTQAWLKLEQNTLRIDLTVNRCWLYHHRFCFTRVQSLPVSQIHSARMDDSSATESDTRPQSTDNTSRVVLVTSLGMLPLSKHFYSKHSEIKQACEDINRFLDSRQNLLSA